MGNNKREVKAMRDENELSPEVANFWFWRHYYKKMEEALETIKREEYDGAHKQLIEGKALTWKARTVLQKRGIPLSSSVLEEWNDMLLETEKLLVMLAGEEYELLAAYLEQVVELAWLTKEGLAKQLYGLG
jgi:hypothetical protein